MGLRNQCSQPPRKDYGYGGCSWRPSQVLMVSLLPLQEHILPQARAYYRVDQAAEPDVWLDAVQVWEVKCADLSLSPVYKAAMGLVSSAAPPTSARHSPSSLPPPPGAGRDTRGLVCFQELGD